MNYSIDPKVFKLAAKLMANDEMAFRYGCCLQIRYARLRIVSDCLTNELEYLDYFDSIFRDDAHKYWRKKGLEGNYYLYWFGKLNKRNKEARILALLLAYELAKDNFVP